MPKRPDRVLVGIALVPYCQPKPRTPPAEAGRRQMTVRVSETAVTVEAADPALLTVAHAALDALGDRAGPAGAIAGHLPAAASLTSVWESLRDSLEDVRRRAGAASLPEPMAEAEED